MEYVWQALDVDGLRLYEVTISQSNTFAVKQTYLVMAKSPRDADALVTGYLKDKLGIEQSSNFGWFIDIRIPFVMVETLTNT